MTTATATERFVITRMDGRSNAQVVLDLVQGGEPGRVYTFDEIAEALSVGATREFNRSDVRSIVAGANQRLLKEQQRVLHNVRHIGYRIAEAKDHRSLALTHKHRADVQLLRGYQRLTHVRYEEMDANARAAHEGTLMVVGALYQQQKAMDRRLTAVEAAIQNLRKT
jgi:hypothetical protein